MIFGFSQEMPTKRGDFNLGGSKEPITQLATPSDVPQQPRAKAEDSTNAEAGRAEKPARPSPKAEDEPTWNETRHKRSGPIIAIASMEPFCI